VDTSVSAEGFEGVFLVTDEMAKTAKVFAALIPDVRE
jgi:hypothetical protein